MTRISYTLMSYYNRGDIDGMIEYYLGIRQEPNEAMARGKYKDDKVTEYINANSALPTYLGGQRLSNPITQLKTEIPYEDYTFVFIPDMISEPESDVFDIWEWKSGTTDLSAWLSTGQLQMYMFLYELMGKTVRYGRLVRIEEQKPEWYLIINSPELQKQTKEYVLDTASKISTILKEKIHD